MEDLVALRGRRVLVTGHTGFKGSWLSLRLADLGAHVHGLALGPPTEPSLFEVARVREVLASDDRIDVRNADGVANVVRHRRPEAILHLAAQPLVQAGYEDPVGTVASNVLGTVHVLEAARQSASVEAVVVVATDKVYENLESGRAFAESDPLGGHDPYSASKAAAEIMVASFRASFDVAEGGPRIASARAGNVVGGGDWARDRLVPDCLRAFAAGQPVRLRAPESVRPWQHVLDPLAGYLLLAARLLAPDGARFARAWNFGPAPRDEATAARVAEMVAERWGAGARVEIEPGRYREAAVLRLDSSLARRELGWSPRWGLDATIDRTVDWTRAWRGGGDMRRLCLDQIRDHEAATAP